MTLTSALEPSLATRVGAWRPVRLRGQLNGQWHTATTEAAKARMLAVRILANFILKVKYN